MTDEKNPRVRRVSGLAAAVSSRRPTPHGSSTAVLEPAAGAEIPAVVGVPDQGQGRAGTSRRSERSVGGRGRPDSDALTQLRTDVRAAVLREMGPRLATAELDDAAIRTAVRTQLDAALRTSSASVSPGERAEFADSILADMLGWGPLTALMADPTVTEVMCNGPYEIYVEREGRLEHTDTRFPSPEALRLVADRMLAVAGRRVDEASPMADGRLADGSRLNVIIPPLSLNGTVLTVRRFPEKAFTVADLIARQALSTDAAVFLEAAVRGKLNVLVSGGTGSGKTTLLNVLSSFIPAAERVITIEDAAELRLEQPHVVSLESRPANIENAGAITIRQLVRNSLRMRPDRIVVGEVRGGEALDMLQAMNTGHEGSLTTVHANAPRDALARVETMVLMSGVELPLRAVREQIASAFDLIIQLERRADGSRAVSSVCEVQGREGDTILLQDVFVSEGGKPLAASGLRPRSLDTLASRGIQVPMHVFHRPVAVPAAGRAVSSRRAAR